MNRSFFIAGVQFRPTHEIKRAMIKIKKGDNLMLESEPTNRYDPNAVKIIFADGSGGLEMIFLGYVPKKFSAEVSALLEAGVELECVVEEANSAANPWEICKVVVREVEE